MGPKLDSLNQILFNYITTYTNVTAVFQAKDWSASYLSTFFLLVFWIWASLTLFQQWHELFTGTEATTNVTSPTETRHTDPIIARHALVTSLLHPPTDSKASTHSMHIH